FVFQAEDGIRDFHVTGVQTCALPIYSVSTWRAIATQVLTECATIVGAGAGLGSLLTLWAVHLLPHYAAPYAPNIGDMASTPSWRSEERRVGKECRSLWWQAGYTRKEV